jgi:hypothetical protein
VLDGSHSAGKIKFWLQSGVTVNQAMIGGDGIRLPLSGLTDSAFTRQSVTYRTLFDDAPEPDVISVVDFTAVMVFSTSDPNQFFMLDIPAIRPDMVVNSGVYSGLRLDTSNPAVISIVNTITNGFWCNPFGYDITDLISTLVERRRT